MDALSEEMSSDMMSDTQVNSSPLYYITQQFSMKDIKCLYCSLEFLFLLEKFEISSSLFVEGTLLEFNF